MKFLCVALVSIFLLAISQQRSICVLNTRKTAGKPDARSHKLERRVKYVLDKSSNSLNCFYSVDEPAALKTKHQTARRLLSFVFKVFPMSSELIHLAWCIKFNPQFIPWLVLIARRGTQFNRGINLSRGYGDLIVG